MLVKRCTANQCGFFHLSINLKPTNLIGINGIIYINLTFHTSFSMMSIFSRLQLNVNLTAAAAAATEKLYLICCRQTVNIYYVQKILMK